MQQKLGRLGIAALIHSITLLLLFHSSHYGRTLPAAQGPQRLLYLTQLTTPRPQPQHVQANATASPQRSQPRPYSQQPDLPPRPASSVAQAVQDSSASEPATISNIVPNAATIMAQARRDLQRIDQEVLSGASAVPAQRPESLSAKLARGIEGAYVGATSEVSDHYTSPDGVMYSRITRGNRSTCYTSGTPSYAAAMRSGGNWVRVNCPPPDSGWVR
jgi:hypothetical protein